MCKVCIEGSPVQGLSTLQYSAARRATAVRRCLRLRDAGASEEHALAEAYDAGRAEGTAPMRERAGGDPDLEGVLALFDDEALTRWESWFPESVRAVRTARAAIASSTGGVIQLGEPVTF
jgi:hypothetical protein